MKKIKNLVIKIIINKILKDVVFMKKTKKFLLMLAVIFTATLALAGCGTSAPTQLATPIASVYLNNGTYSCFHNR